METIACPLCGARDSEIISRISDVNVPSINVICEVCALVYTNPRMDEKERAAYYHNIFAQSRHGIDSIEKAKERIEKKGSLKKCEPVADWILSIAEKNPQILEIGCSYGYLLKTLRDKGATVKGVEPSATESLFAKSFFNLDVDAVSFEEFGQSSAGQQYDVVIINHVLEHLPNPPEVLNILAKLLKPNGVIYIAVPDITRIVEAITTFFQIPHIIYFSPATLYKTIARAGMKVIAQTDALPKYGMHVICAQEEHSAQRLSFDAFNRGSTVREVKVQVMRARMTLGVLRALKYPVQKLFVSEKRERIVQAVRRVLLRLKIL